MKKIFSILLTLVLAVSLLMVPMAVSATLGVVELQTEGDGTATAEWTTVEKKVGDYSVLLNSGTTDGTNAARVTVPYGDILASITSLSFWMNIKSATLETLYTDWWVDGIEKDGYVGAYIILELDRDGDGIKDEWLVLKRYGEVSINTWVERSLAEGFHSDLSNTGLANWHTVYSDDLVTWSSKLTHGTLEQWQGTTLGDATVLKVKIAVGEWGWPNVEAYIDDLTINDITYALEPATGQLDMTATFTALPPVIGISVDTLLVDFGDITLGEIATGSPEVTVTNTGTVAVNLDATIEDELPLGIYSADSPNGLTIGGTHVSEWLGAAAVDGSTGPLTLTLLVPTGTDPGTYLATLVFWATAQ